MSFPVWAFAQRLDPGEHGPVVFPEGYRSNVAAGDMPAPTTAADGTVVLETRQLVKTPLTFFAYLVADRAGPTTDHEVAGDRRRRPGAADDQRLAGRRGVGRAGR